MARKSSKRKASARKNKHKDPDKQGISEPYSDTLPLIEFRFDDPLFQVVAHPEKPILVFGLSNGYIYCYKYNPELLLSLRSKNQKLATATTANTDKERETNLWKTVVVPPKKSDPGDADSGKEVDGGDEQLVALLWKTRRHKGSVRCLSYDPSGEHIYSVGTDNVLKKADSLSGKVVKKVSLPNDGHKFTKMRLSNTVPLLLIGDEAGNVLVLDTVDLKLVNKVGGLHGGDAINDIFHYEKKSAYRFISTGQTTLAYWNCRPNAGRSGSSKSSSGTKVVESEDQEDEILCGTFLNSESADTVVCGMGEGILTIWKPEKNDLEDQVSRIKVSKNSCIDCIIPTLQDDDCVWCGSSDGFLYRVNVKRGSIIEAREHSEIDEVQFLDLDCGYRVVSGGMDCVKVWEFRDSNESDGKVVGNESSDDDGSEGEIASASDSESTSSEGWQSSDGAGSESELVPSDRSSKLSSREELLAELGEEEEEGGEDEFTIEGQQGATNVKKRGAQEEGNRKKREKKRKIARKGATHTPGILKFDDL